jgi:hypothetical protein
MAQVRLPTGEILQFPDTMSEEEIQTRANHAWRYRSTFGRMPSRVTREGASTDVPQGRSLDDIVRSGMEVRRQIQRGQLTESKATDAERLARDIADRKIRPEDLTRDQKAILGMSQPWYSEIARGFGENIGPEGWKGSPGFLPGIGQAGRRGYEVLKNIWTMPVEDLPVAGRVQSLVEPPNAGPVTREVNRRLAGGIIGLPERILMSPGAIIPALHPDPKQQEILGGVANLLMGELMARQGAGVPITRRAAVRRQTAGEPPLTIEEPKTLREELVPPPSMETTAEGTRVRMRPTGPARVRTGQAEPIRIDIEQRMLPPAPPPAPGPLATEPTGFEILSGVRRTREQLPGEVGAAQRELPPARPIEREVQMRSEGPTGFEILRGARAEQPATIGRVGPLEAPLPPRLAPPSEMTKMGEQGLIAGTPAREIPTRPTRAVVPQAESAGALFERPGPVQPGLPEPPVAPKGLVWEPRPPSRGALNRFVSKDGRFVVDQAGPDTWTVQDRIAGGSGGRFATFQDARQWAQARQEQAVGAAPPARGRSVSQPIRREPVSAEGLNLGDPDDLRKWIIGEGGLKRGPESASIKGVPGLFRKDGLAIDELAQRLAQTRGISAKQAENEIARTLENYGRLKEAKRRGELPGASRDLSDVRPGGMRDDPGFQVRPDASLDSPPAKYSRAIPEAEWAKLSPIDRTELMNSFDDLGRTNPELLAKLGALGLGAAAVPAILRGLRGQPQDKAEGQHPLIGRLLNTIKDLGARMARPPTSPLLTKEAARSDERRTQDRLKELGQLAAAAIPMFGALGMGARGIRGRGPLEPPPGVPRGAQVLEGPPMSALRETIRPEVLRPEPPKGPPSPPRPPAMEPAEPSPWRGVSASSTTGAALRGIPDITRQAYSTILGRLEKWGPAGQEIARLMQRVAGDHDAFVGKHGDPIVRELKRLRLSPEEKENLVNATDLGEAPMNERVAGFIRNFYEPVFGVNGVIPEGADKRGVMTQAFGEEAKPFQAREHFYPHEFDPAFVRELLRPQTAARRNAIAQLVEREGVDAETAGVMLDDYFRSTVTRQGQRIVYMEPDRFVGGLERARELNIDGWIRDPEVALPIRVSGVGRRFAEIDHYGYNDAKIGESSRVAGRPGQGPTKPVGLVGAIQHQFGSAEATKAFQLFKYVVGVPVEESNMQALARVVTTAEAFTKLPLAFVANATQPALTAFRTSLSTAARGFVDAVLHPSQSVLDARELGTIGRQSLRELHQEIRNGYPSKLVDFALRPFSMAEQWNRIVSVNAGKAWSGKLDGWLRRGEREAFVRRELERLNFSAEEVADRMNAHQLRAGDETRIQWAVVDQTQFLATRARRTEGYYAHPLLGPVLMQFKHFSINNGRLMRQMFATELRRGDPRSIANAVATLAVAFPLIGELALDTRAFLRGRSRETDIDHPVSRVLEDFFAVGGFGLATDFVESLAHGGRAAAFSTIAGPGFTDAVTAADHLYRMGTALGGDAGEFKKASRNASRYLARQIPYVGPRLSEALRVDQKGEDAVASTWSERLGYRTDFKRIALEDKQRKAVQAQANALAAQGRPDAAHALIDAWNIAHSSARAQLSAASITRRQHQAQQTPEQRRLGRLSPEARARLRRELELEEAR